MGTLGNNIRALRVSHGLSQREFGEIAGVSRSAVARWEGNETTFIHPSTSQAILAHFNITEDDLFSHALGYASKNAQPNGYGPAAERAAFVPFVTFYDTNSQEDGVEYVEVPVSIAVAHPNSFACKVLLSEVDRMIPLGGTAVIDPELEIEQGSLALVELKGEYRILRVYLGQSGVMLSPDSTRGGSDIFVSKEEVTVVGPVVWWLGRLRIDARRAPGAHPQATLTRVGNRGREFHLSSFF